MPSEPMKAEDRAREVARALEVAESGSDLERAIIAAALESYASQQVLAARLEELERTKSHTSQHGYCDSLRMYVKERIAALEQQQAKVANGLTVLGAETEEG